MANGMRQGRSHEGVPDGDPIIEVTVRLFPRPGAGTPSYPPRGGPFNGATIDWSYPEHLHARALDRIGVVRHAISVLLDDLDGSTTLDVS
jgi:hypothetical protein